MAASFLAAGVVFAADYAAKCASCHAANGKGKMPAFKDKLSTDQIKALCAALPK